MRASSWSRALRSLLVELCRQLIVRVKFVIRWFCTLLRIIVEMTDQYFATYSKCFSVTESGIVEDVTSSAAAAPATAASSVVDPRDHEDACTQTTLRRPPKKDISRSLSVQDVRSTSSAAAANDMTSRNTITTKPVALIGAASSVVHCCSDSAVAQDSQSNHSTHTVTNVQSSDSDSSNTFNSECKHSENGDVDAGSVTDQNKTSTSGLTFLSTDDLEESTNV